MRVLSRITVPKMERSPEPNAAVSETENLETIKADNGQATIENFLEHEED
jgi:hypothetical protein